MFNPCHYLFTSNNYSETEYHRNYNKNYNFFVPTKLTFFRQKITAFNYI